MYGKSSSVSAKKLRCNGGRRENKDLYFTHCIVKISALHRYHGSTKSTSQTLVIYTKR